MAIKSSQFDLYKDIKKQTVAILGESIAIANKVSKTGPTEEMANVLSQMLQRTEDNSFNLVVVGEFSSGKSYFINLLLDKIWSKQTKPTFFKVAGMLPTKLSPTTSTITIIRYGTPERAIITFKNGETAEVPLDQLEGYLAEAVFSEQQEFGGILRGLFKPGIKQTRVKQVEIFCDSPWLSNGISIVDTPGTGSVVHEHAAITASYIPEADAIIFMFTAQPPINNQARLFLSQCAFHVDRFFFVQTRKDNEYNQGKDNEWHAIFENGRPTLEVATEQNQAILATVISSTPSIFSISSLWAAQCKLDLKAPPIELSGYPQLLDSLEHFLVQNRGLVSLRSRISHARSLIASLGVEMAALEAQAGKTVEDLEKQLSKQEPVVKGIQEKANALREMVDEELDEAVQKASGGANEAFNFLRDHVMPELRSSSLDKASNKQLNDIASNIAYLVQQSMNGWISKRSYEDVRPVFRNLRQNLRKQGHDLERSVKELADVSCAISDVLTRLGTINISDVALPDTSIIEKQMKSVTSKVAVKESNSGGFWQTISNAASSFWGWLTGKKPSESREQVRKISDEIEKLLTPMLKDMSSLLAASFGSFLENQAKDIKKRIMDATNEVIRVYDGSLRDLKNRVNSQSSKMTQEMEKAKIIRRMCFDMTSACDTLIATIDMEVKD